MILLCLASPELTEAMELYLKGHTLEVHSCKPEKIHSELTKFSSDELKIIFCSTVLLANDPTLVSLLTTRLADTLLVTVGELPISSIGQRHVSHASLVEDLKDLMSSGRWRQAIGDISRSRPVSISPYLVFRLGVCPADLFVKLSSDNWVKLFHQGTVFGEEEMQKFEQRGLQEFWILADDVKLATGHLEDLLAGLVPTEDDPSLVTEVHEMLINVLQQGEFSLEVQTLTRKAVETALKMIEKMPDLKSCWQAMVRPENSWMVKHSMLLAQVNCLLASKLGWGSDHTALKLVFASMLHDTHVPKLNEAEWPWLVRMTEQRFGKIELDDDLKAFMNHPVLAAEMLRSFRQIPADVDRIVREHHERPDGHGFPRGLLAHQIAPLSALFIIGHEITQILLAMSERGIPWTDMALREALPSTLYQQGVFKKLWQEIEKTSFFAPTQVEP